MSESTNQHIELKENAAEDEEVFGGVPPDLLKRYYCGFGPCRPKWLQVMANKKIFTLLLCLFAFLQGAVVSGFTSAVLSTIQTRYQFTTIAAGLISVSYDVAIMISIVFISYFGGNAHRPRWLGASLVVMGIGTLVFASPQFLYGRYEVGSVSGQQELELCNDDRNFTSECKVSNHLAYSTYLLGNILIGIGAAPLYTVGLAYIDELVYPKYVPVHFGVFQLMSVFGPTFGYGVGSAFLSVYVDPWVETTLKTTDPAWVGAWWMPFSLASVWSFLLCIPFLMYPKWLPDSHLVRKERAKEMAKIYPKKYANENKFTITVKMFPIHIKRLLTNPSFMFHAISTAFLFLVVTGLTSFAPKYFQNQFHLTATVAGFVAGGVGISAAGIGTGIGSIVLYLTKLRGRKLALFITVIYILTIPLTPTFLLNCSTIKVAGVTVPYSDSINGFSECASACNCSSSVFEPVCGADGITYFSPCRAGCSQRQEEEKFFNCSCVTDTVQPVDVSSGISQMYDIPLSNYSSASNGRCRYECSSLFPFVLLIFLALVLLFVLQIPVSYYTVRVVADDQRSLALGLASAFYRVFGTIPSHIIFGALFDSACLYWQNECGLQGNCWVYDNDRLSRMFFAYSCPCLIACAFFFFLAFVTFPKRRDDSVDPPPSNRFTCCCIGNSSEESGSKRKLLPK